MHRRRENGGHTFRVRGAWPACVDVHIGPAFLQRAANVDYDDTKIDEAVLALLGALQFDGGRVWKRYDFAVMDRLHRKGYITEPRGRQESVYLTDEGMRVAKQLAAPFRPP